MMNIISGLNNVAVQRLKSTWERVPGKYSRILAEMLTVVDPTRNFSRYRNLVQNSCPPLIPIYPMVKKDITFIHLGNESKVEALINFEKLRMLAKEIRLLTNMCSSPLDLLSMLAHSGSEISEPWRTLNPAAHSGGPIKPTASASGTMKRGQAGHKRSALGFKDSGGLNAKRMYEEAQMVRRVKAYINKMDSIVIEDGKPPANSQLRSATFN